MNILVPINNLENIETYLECGAKEFYIGFYAIDWTQT